METLRTTTQGLTTQRPITSALAGKTSPPYTFTFATKARLLRHCANSPPQWQSPGSWGLWLAQRNSQSGLQPLSSTNGSAQDTAPLAIQTRKLTSPSLLYSLFCYTYLYRQQLRN